MFGMAKQMKGFRIPYALAVYDDHEIKRVVSVLKEHREAMDKETAEFEKKIAKAFGNEQLKNSLSLVRQ
jgi:dTDP-4-amino-4,6-dideoxygalactose transaminase